MILNFLILSFFFSFARNTYAYYVRALLVLNILMSEDQNTGLFVTELVSMLKDKLQEQVATSLHSSCHYVSLKKTL